MKRLSHYIYNGAITCLLPVFLLRLYFRGNKQPEYRKRWRERRGFVPFDLDRNKPTVWFHAVSAGEVNAMTPLIKRFQHHFNDHNLVLTTMTPTGSLQAQKIKDVDINHMYVPYDYPKAIKRFLNTIEPSLLVIMETELWPNVIDYTHQRNIPILVANGRISPKSLPSYQKARWFFKPFLEELDTVCAQSDEDSARFRQIGCPSQTIINAGNLKYDMTIDETARQKAYEFRHQHMPDRQIWVAGSTHNGEESEALKAHSHLLQQDPNRLLILVPRHPQRFDEVAALCEQHGLKTARRSQQEAPQQDDQVFLIDKMGELVFMYGCSDVAFVGGSLADIGGHNPLEPTAMGVPVISGPRVFNFNQVYESLEKANGVITVQNAEQLAEQVQDLLSRKDKSQSLTQNALTVLKANQGALERHMHVINQYLDQSD